MLAGGGGGGRPSRLLQIRHCISKVISCITVLKSLKPRELGQRLFHNFPYMETQTLDINIKN